MSDQRPIGFWLGLVDRLIEEQFATTLEEHGITRRQWQLLSILSQGPASLVNLDAAVAQFQRPAADGAAAESSLEHLAELVESEWVAVSADSYSVTERGSAAFQRLADVITENRVQISEGVTDEEYLATVAVLERIAANLGWVEPV